MENYKFMMLMGRVKAWFRKIAADCGIENTQVFCPIKAG